MSEDFLFPGDQPVQAALPLDAAQVCNLYAGIENRELPVDALEGLLTPDATFVTKLAVYQGRDEIMSKMRQIASPDPNGLAGVSLAGRQWSEDGVDSAHVVWHVSASDPTRLQGHISFGLQGSHITRIFQYAEWLEPKWPHPEMALREIERLRSLGIKFAEPAPPQVQLEWKHSIDEGSDATRGKHGNFSPLIASEHAAGAKNGP